MAQVAPARNQQPALLRDARQTRRTTGIEIAGWSSHMLAVETKSPGQHWDKLPYGIVSALAWLGDVSLNPLWRLELLPQGIRVRNRYRWSAIAWEQISAVESVASKPGVRRESVVLTLASHASQTLGTFDGVFARTLRDRLRYEVAQHSNRPLQTAHQ